MGYYDEQPDYSWVPLVFIACAIVGMIIGYFIIKAAVKNGINASVLGQEKIEAAARRAETDSKAKAEPPRQESSSPKVVENEQDMTGKTQEPTKDSVSYPLL